MTSSTSSPPSNWFVMPKSPSIHAYMSICLVAMDVLLTILKRSSVMFYHIAIAVSCSDDFVLMIKN